MNKERRLTINEVVVDHKSLVVNPCSIFRRKEVMMDKFDLEERLINYTVLDHRDNNFNA